MHVEHSLTMIAKCPVNGATDFYDVTFILDKFINVEALMVEMLQYHKQPIYQEDLTQKLADFAKCEVITHGIHSGIRTMVRCAPAPE